MRNLLVNEKRSASLQDSSKVKSDVTELSAISKPVGTFRTWGLILSRLGLYVYTLKVGTAQTSVKKIFDPALVPKIERVVLLESAWRRKRGRPTISWKVGLTTLEELNRNKQNLERSTTAKYE